MTAADHDAGIVVKGCEDIESTNIGSTSCGSAGSPTTAEAYLKDTLRCLRLTWPVLLGNILEWYEFGVYSYVEHEIAENFFEGSSLGAWLGYAVTFVGRPLGGIIFGIIADRCGRALSVTLSLGGMMVATVAQGCLPGKYFGGDFEGLGLVLLIMCRVLQGLSAGGEIGAVVAYLMEVSPVRSVGMAVCMIGVGSQMSWVFSSAMVALLHQALGSKLMLVWGWRVPFLISALPSALAMWGRRRIQETGVFLSEVREKQNQQDVHQSLRELLTHFPVVLLIGIGGVCAAATMWYGPPFWTLTAVLSHLDPSDVLWVGNSCQLVALAVTPLAGWFTDQYGAAMTALVGAIYATLAFPVYLWLVLDPSLGTAYLAMGLFFGIAQGFNGATIQVFCANLFPPRLRCQGMALSYNIGVSFLGGFAAAISQALFQVEPLSPGIYWSCMGMVTSVTLLLALFLRNRGLVKLSQT
eukprot:s958_g18.t1